ncbi:uncharacterized protein DS421_19g657720 [Arachis hypogaea]|uniref:Uncharacterized protein n=1 Tax=Arachis hypogaea TaxID=3818 RepID=A0A6B9V968_ARAHY|nr:uncharacterized protein DS421_19g657720 [Arachis hypogaea]
MGQSLPNDTSSSGDFRRQWQWHFSATRGTVGFLGGRNGSGWAWSCLLSSVRPGGFPLAGTQRRYCNKEHSGGATDRSNAATASFDRGKGRRHRDRGGSAASSPSSLRMRRYLSPRSLCCGGGEAVWRGDLLPPRSGDGAMAAVRLARRCESPSPPSFFRGSSVSRCLFASDSLFMEEGGFVWFAAAGSWGKTGIGQGFRVSFFLSKN